MAQIIDNRTELDKTVRIFDSFYATNLIVPAAQYDIVLGYFTNVCKTKNVAENFTTVLFRVAQETDIDVLTLLEQIKGTPTKLKMTQLMAYYMNSFKSKTSLYGISLVTKPNEPVQRNIVQ